MSIDIQDNQDGTMSNDVQYGADKELKYEAITKAIIGCAFDVLNELGAGFLESVYERAMLIALEEKGINAAAQHPMRVMFRKECVGEFFADMLVEDKIIVELKAVKSIAPEHQAQIINYLNATGCEVGLILNFGLPRLQYRRCTRCHDPKAAD